MDAEGSFEHVACPQCGSTGTITFHYSEGFSELECPSCGYRSDAEELGALQRYPGDLLEAEPARSAPPPIPVRGLKA